MVPSAEARNLEEEEEGGMVSPGPFGCLSGGAKDGWKWARDEGTRRENGLAEAQGRVSSIQKMMADSGVTQGHQGVMTVDNETCFGFVQGF